ncbi:histidinol-phosphatase HisJ family protein [Virgibacillus alimentarius]|uniref:Histidinol-phosphatase n=1 Tax=Virgibacillus alimentarius TaxID=698769 RepID=A0ABS4S8P8_9BACI|nr:MULTISPECIES: histidinol-phosphatase HisJ family protein [Virgibacillus]MBP2257254.1 histidinol-phosphatase (PHP family) [Virgibacillus alimentarius]HLR67364.1 histidinol-phosphatase HisJ family protein [Virgibacillus sp.]
MFDYHLHSDFSADCKTPMEETVQRAIELGLSEICFTEHIDYEYPDPTIDFDLDLPAYDKKIQELRQLYENRISIKKGVELGLQPHQIQDYTNLMERERFDFVICSMHTADKKDLHSGSFFADKTIDEAYTQYYEELLYCVTHFKHFNIMGHIDLVKRYTEKADHDFHDAISEIFKVIIPSGKGIELNTSGVRYGLHSGMPSPDILKLYQDCGGEIITLGSDSHVASTVAYQFKESIELLKSLGFKYIATFDNQEPIFHSLNSL